MMTTQTKVRSTEEALKLALKDLKWVDNWLCEKPMAECVTKLRKSITAIKEALAQPAVAEQHKQRSVRTSVDSEQQEPVAWKPIETAPKDVMILVCLPRQMNLVVRAWYNSIHNFWQTDYEGEGGITRPMYFHEGDLWHPIPPLYTAPPQHSAIARTAAEGEDTQGAWVGLTDEEKKNIFLKWYGKHWAYTEQVQAVMDSVEAKLKAKNERLEKNI